MISILIPIYNGIEFIDDSITSVLNQTYKQWELLIGINGHKINSPVYQTAKEYEKVSNKIKVFDFHEIKGKANTLNELIKYCSYNYVAILDVDDIWNPKKLEIQSQYFVNNYDVIGTRCVWFGDRPGIIPHIPIGDISDCDFCGVNPIINSSCIIKKQFCYWSNKWDGVEDYDLWLKLRKSGKRFYNCKEVLVKHRVHRQSAFNSKGNNDKVDSLLISHGFKTRMEMLIEKPKINFPPVSKINMKLF
jgi:teichuronic acid biosynthesis glycosyltransferase TuaG